MTIETHQPELEALIQQRMASGQLVQELSAAKPRKQNLTQFLKESPLWGSGLTVERSKDATRQVEL